MLVYGYLTSFLQCGAAQAGMTNRKKVGKPFPQGANVFSSYFLRTCRVLQLGVRGVVVGVWARAVSMV